MVGVLLDTNIYGRFVEDGDAPELTKAIENDKGFIVHNFRIIRDELRRAKNILPIYDRITTNNIITVNPFIEKLAKEYFNEYKKNEGVHKKDNNFMNDLRIIACASAKNFNLIFSDDKRSMHNEIAKNAYNEINLKYNLRTPTFHTYKDLKRKYLNK